MRELSVFVDESGNLGDDAKYYLLALVLHDQSQDVFEHIGRYESTLAQRGLRDIPLHMNPLMRANEDYKGMTAQERNRLLTCFGSFAWKCPFSYEVLSYRKSHFKSDEDLFSKMKRDLILLLFDKLETLQAYDIVKIYYDDGQGMVTDSAPRRLRVRTEQAGHHLQGMQPRGLPAPADSGLHLRDRTGRDQVRSERGRRNREVILRHQPRLQEELP